ncbi:MAG: ABC transporter permease [Bacillota bacterium]
MGLWDIVLNNLKRRKEKTFFIIAGIVISIATVTALFSLTAAMSDKMARDMEAAGRKVLMTPKSEKVSFSFGGITVAENIAFDVEEMPHDTLLQLINRSQELDIRLTAPKKIHSVEIAGKENLIVGIDISNELKVRPWLLIKGAVPAGDNQVLLGSNIAQAYGKAAGDSLDLGGRYVVVSGVFQETGQQEDNILMAPLTLVEELSGNTNLNLIEVVLDNSPDTPLNILKIKEYFPEVKVTAVQEAMEARKELIGRYKNFTFLVSAIILLIAGLIVITTMLSSVNERVKEIGIFRALGFRKTDIIKIFLLESAVACSVGGMSGYGAGLLIARAATPMVDAEGLIININPLLGISVVAIALIIGLCASWFPASRAAKLDPAEALRYL